jgi:gas vesicle protein
MESIHNDVRDGREDNKTEIKNLKKELKSIATQLSKIEQVLEEVIVDEDSPDEDDIFKL